MLEYFEEMMAIMEFALGDVHPYAEVIYHYMAEYYLRVESYADAIWFLKKCLAVINKCLGVKLFSKIYLFVLEIIVMI